MNTLALLLSAAVVYSAAGDSPFVGKWKLNPAKSQFVGTTITYEQLPAGEIRSTAEGQSYSFRLDGKEYSAPFSMTAAWKEIDATTWQVTYKLKDRVLSTDTVKVDGKTLTVNSKGQLPDGTAFDDNVTYQRVSGGPGLTGKWKSTKITISAPLTMEFSPRPGGGLSWTIPSLSAAVALTFDGKDNPAEGPTLPPNLTLAATAKGPRSFELVQKVNAKVVSRGTFTLSSDGKTLTAVSAAEGTSETVTAVYDRQ